MTSYFLLNPDVTRAFHGSYSECLSLGSRLCNNSAFDLLKLARARAGEPKAIIIYDLTNEGFKQTRSNRVVDVKKLLRAYKNAPLGEN